VAHRDLKPANIFITDECFIRIGDLGLCRLMIDPSQTFVGSPIYMSPEQHNNQPYSLAGDIWAVGCTMYEILMKRPPFVGTTIDEVRSNIDS
jgi:NIMA (never in mitosis gene a)-related kinase